MLSFSSLSQEADSARHCRETSGQTVAKGTLLEQIQWPCVWQRAGVFCKECQEEENPLKLGMGGRGQRVIKDLLRSLYLGERDLASPHKTSEFKIYSNPLGSLHKPTSHPKPFCES